MDKKLYVSPIGTIRSTQAGACLEIAPEFRRALLGLEGFGSVQVLWWFSGCDDPASRAGREERSPYARGPEVLGTFATRSPCRPNPIALSCAGVTYLDLERGVVGLDYVDGAEGSPVLDIKPYVPSLDRVERPRVPDWCAHWPACVEDSGEFDWDREYTPS